MNTWTYISMRKNTYLARQTNFKTSMCGRCREWIQITEKVEEDTDKLMAYLSHKKFLKGVWFIFFFPFRCIGALFTLIIIGFLLPELFLVSPTPTTSLVSYKPSHHVNLCTGALKERTYCYQFVFLQVLTVCLTIRLSHAYDKVGVKGLPLSLSVHQLHGTVLQATLNVGKDRLVPCVQH